MVKRTIESVFFETVNQGNGKSLLGMASLAAEYFHRAEQEFGERNGIFVDDDGSIMPIVYCGVEFIDGGPHTYYPKPGGKWRGHVAIQLNIKHYADPMQLWYGLAQECVHCLFATGTQQANVAEEGMTIRFADAQMKSLGAPNWVNGSAKYRKAKEHLDALMAIDPAAIKTLRHKQPYVHRWTKNVSSN